MIMTPTNLHIEYSLTYCFGLLTAPLGEKAKKMLLNGLNIKVSTKSAVMYNLQD